MALLQEIESNGYRARADRRFQSGRILDVDAVSKLSIIDVGATLPDGSAVYLHQVPYSPQQPPKVGDSVVIGYTNSSPHSVSVTGMAVGANSQSQTFGNGGVAGIHATGQPVLIDVVELLAGTGITLTQVAQGITIASTGSVSPATSVTEVGASGVVGTSVLYARQDHVHKGVHSLAKHAGTSLFGDVTLAEGSNVTLSVTGNEITINSTASGSGISVKPNGGAAVGPQSTLNVIAGTNIASVNAVVTGSQIDLTINAATQSGSGGDTQIGGLQSPGVGAVIKGELYTVIYTGLTGSAHTYTLPTIAGGTSRAHTYLIVNDDNNNLTVAAGGGGSDTIEGYASVVLGPGQRAFFTAMENGDAKWKRFGYTPEIAQRGAGLIIIGGWTLTREDAGSRITYGAAGVSTVNIPANSVVPFPVGTVIEIQQGGTGKLTVQSVGGAGVGVNGRGGLVGTNGQYSVIRIVQNAVDQWIVDGDTA